MQLKRFTLPKADERLITIDKTIFKIKIILVKQQNRSENSYEDFCSNAKHQEEIEKIVTILLTSKDDPRPIQTDNLTVYPYRNKWTLADALQFYRNKVPLKACPYVNTFYVHPKLPPLKRPHQDTQKQSTKPLLQNTATQTSLTAFTDQTDDAGTKCQGQGGNDEKSSDTVKPPKIAKDTDQMTTLEPEQKHKELPPSSSQVKAEDETEGESGDQSVSILHGLNPYDASSPANPSIGRVSGDIEDDSPIYSTARNAREEEKPRTQSETGELDMKGEIKVQRGKRRSKTLDEAEPKKKNYSVTEYVDKNRHEVQEQDLQELLRFQELATPVEEKPTACADGLRSSCLRQNLVDNGNGPNNGPWSLQKPWRHFIIKRRTTTGQPTANVEFCHENNVWF